MCKAGCGQRIKRSDHEYCSHQCVPRSIRSEGARKGRKAFAYRRRAMLFRRVFERMADGRQELSKEAILDAFMEVYREGYNRGHRAASWAQKHSCEPAGAAAADAMAGVYERAS